MITEPQQAHIAHHIHPIGCAAAVVVDGEPNSITNNGILGAATGVNGDVGTIAAIDGVVAGAGVDRVVSAAGINAVGTALGSNRIVTAAAKDRFIIAAPIDRVVAGAAIKQRTVNVIPPLSDVVVTFAAINCVRSVSTI